MHVYAKSNASIILITECPSHTYTQKVIKVKVTQFVSFPVIFNVYDVQVERFLSYNNFCRLKKK